MRYYIKYERAFHCNRLTLGNGLAGLQCNPPQPVKFGKYGRGNSKSQYVLMSQISAFPMVSHSVVGLPGENERSRLELLAYIFAGKKLHH